MNKTEILPWNEGSGLDCNCGDIQTEGIRFPYTFDTCIAKLHMLFAEDTW